MHPARQEHSHALSPSEPFLGSWKAIGEADYFVQFDQDRYTVAFAGQVRSVARILAYEKSQVRLCDRGREKLVGLVFQGDELVLTELDSNSVHHFTRIDVAPPELNLTPLQLPEVKSLPAETVAEIQRQLWERLVADGKAEQTAFGGLESVDPEVWRRPVAPPRTSWSDGDFRWIETTAQNTEYLKGVVARVGWIDATRFGSSAAKAAVLLVLHSRDLPLMLAALPEVQRDVAEGRLEAEGYALLYDRSRLALGEKQRYATQVGTDTVGRSIVLPVEDPARVDELRRGLGMVPLAQYLKLFGAGEVRFSPACPPQGDRNTLKKVAE
jgi:hypothetical protein